MTLSSKGKRINAIPIINSEIKNFTSQILDIVAYGHPVLRQTAKSVLAIDDEARKLIANMLATLGDADGVGLAANQVGVAKKIAIVDIGEGPIILINPKIIKKSKKCKKLEEGCLSVPGVSVLVKRPEKIEIENIDFSSGQKTIIRAEDLLARVILHEMDHLVGKLLIDRLSFYQKAKLRGQLKKIKNSSKK
ncbi:MAG: peptide deformylase [Patescibacteria group bacterium]|nr:peptide deformylase [Patescibacteria group bacterium]MDD5121406.1 peptide deformylase [Patescibacteria group bacterium]MDD5221868.1 peptide deformylase [Patescibacteria group bacterium]MDD5395675.1 peptide deformylase [Patescibacteria group bacterium]